MNPTDDRVLDALDLSDDAKDALRAIKAEVEGAYEDELARLRKESAHWREHVEAVDAICSEKGIPVQREDGSRIFTEDRVRMALSSVVPRPEFDEERARWLISKPIMGLTGSVNELATRADELKDALTEALAVIDALTR